MGAGQLDGRADPFRHGIQQVVAPGYGDRSGQLIHDLLGGLLPLRGAELRLLQALVLPMLDFGGEFTALLRQTGNHLEGVDALGEAALLRDHDENQLIKHETHSALRARSVRKDIHRGRVLTDRMAVVNEVEVSVLSEWDEDVVAELARLLPQVSSGAHPLTTSRVRDVVRSPSTHVLVARMDGGIAAMALLLVCSTFAGDFGLVEEVAVDEEVRGRHLGVHLMVGLLRHANELGLRFVDLTSRPSRVAANNLYKKLGFDLRETNCYRHHLDPVPAPW